MDDIRRRAEFLAGLLGDEFTADSMEDAMRAELTARYATPERPKDDEDEGEWYYGDSTDDFLP